MNIEAQYRLQLSNAKSHIDALQREIEVLRTKCDDLKKSSQVKSQVSFSSIIYDIN